MIYNLYLTCYNYNKMNNFIVNKFLNFQYKHNALFTKIDFSNSNDRNCIKY